MKVNKPKRTPEINNLNKKQKEKDLMFQQMIACSIYRRMPEDYWEKEGFG